MIIELDDNGNNFNFEEWTHILNDILKQYPGLVGEVVDK